MKSDVVNVDLSEYATIDQVNEVLTENYMMKNDIVIKNDNMITEQLEIIKYTYIPDSIKDIEIHQYKFPKATLYIKGTTKDDAKIDISGTYNYTSFDGINWYYNRSDTEEIKIKYFMYDGYVFYNKVVEVDIAEALIAYETNQFENNIVPSMNYLIHNYATTAQLTTKLEDYITKSALTDDYYNADEINESFASKNELKTVNNKFADYALKSEIPEPIDLSEYRKYNDFTVPYGVYDFLGETAFDEFHEGAQLEGYAIAFDREIDDFVHRDFSITFHTDSVVDGTRRWYNIYISEEVEGFWWDEESNAFYAGGEVAMAVHLNSAKLATEDKLVLKSEYDVKIKSLEERRAALEAR